MNLNFNLLKDIFYNTYCFIILVDKNYQVALVNHLKKNVDNKNNCFQEGKSIFLNMNTKNKNNLKKVIDGVFKTAVPTSTQIQYNDKKYANWYKMGISPLIQEKNELNYLVITQIDISNDKALEQENIRLKKNLLIAKSMAVTKKNYALSKFLKTADSNELLTKRENEINHLVIIGYTSKEISQKLNISTKTVDNHRYNIYKKISKTLD